MSFMLLKNISLAIGTLRSSRGRSLLTMLGIIIAVGAVVTVVSIGRGIQTAVAEQTNQYSKNVITIRPADIGTSEGAFSGLSDGVPAASITDQDVTDISKVPHVHEAVPLTIVGSKARADASYEGVVFAVSSELPQVLNQELAYGAYFTSRETNNNVAVLGAAAADKLFDQRVPLGRSFTISGQQFIVSGVLTKFTASPFSSSTNFNDAIFVPTSAINTLAPNGAPVYEVLAKVDGEQHVAAADKNITKELSKNHGNQQAFRVLSPSELASDSTDTFEILADFITAAALITLLVSGVGIMNVMLVSVTERIHEIGIRKAVGATNRQILGQFVTEAAVLSLVGSIIGAIVALATVGLLRAFTTLAPVYDLPTAGLAAGVACAFGIIFGTIPAVKAARKDPIDALRSE